MALHSTLSNPSQVLQRNESLFTGKSILVAGNIDDHYPTHLQTITSTSTFCFNDYRYYEQLKDQLTASNVYFTADFQGNENQQKFDLLLIYIPKAKPEIEYLLANLTPHLKENAGIVLV
ncbi:MAG: 16S rRNA (guanine(1207)-N(2))-methyltransferase RsmC, partial [Psychromonas sp.]